MKKKFVMHSFMQAMVKYFSPTSPPNAGNRHLVVVVFMYIRWETIKLKKL